MVSWQRGHQSIFHYFYVRKWCEYFITMLVMPGVRECLWQYCDGRILSCSSVASFTWWWHSVMDSRVLWDCLHDALFEFPWALLIIGPQGQFNDACVKETWASLYIFYFNSSLQSHSLLCKTKFHSDWIPFRAFSPFKMRLFYDKTNIIIYFSSLCVIFSSGVQVVWSQC